jgi:hypothetical protein
MRITPTRRWQAAMLGALAIFAATAPLVTAAPRAYATPEPSDEYYLDLLSGLPVNDQFSKETLLQEGHKACGAMQHGAAEDNVTAMVQSDLHISNYDAFRLVSSAELGLSCFSRKIHGQQ